MCAGCPFGSRLETAQTLPKCTNRGVREARRSSGSRRSCLENESVELFILKAIIQCVLSVGVNYVPNMTYCCRRTSRLLGIAYVDLRDADVLS